MTRSRSRRSGQPAAVHHPVEPPDHDGDSEHVRVLGEQLVGVHEVDVRRGEHGRQREGDDAPGPAPDDAVVQHQPGGEHGDLDELEAVEVDAPEAHERRQQQRPAPRVDRRGHRRAVVEEEPVVGDDVGDVALEQALGHADVQRPVVAGRVAAAMEVDGDERGAEDEQREQDAGDPPAGEAPFRCGGSPLPPVMRQRAAAVRRRLVEDGSCRGPHRSSSTALATASDSIHCRSRRAR